MLSQSHQELEMEFEKLDQNMDWVETVVTSLPFRNKKPKKSHKHIPKGDH